MAKLIKKLSLGHLLTSIIFVSYLGSDGGVVGEGVVGVGDPEGGNSTEEQTTKVNVIRESHMSKI